MASIKAYFTKSNIITYLIFFVFLIELFATLYLEYSPYTSTRLVGFYKLLLIIALLFFFNIKKLEKKSLVIVSCLIIIVLTNQFLFNPIFFDNTKSNFLSGSIYYSYRFLYCFIFIIMFTSIKDFTIISSKVLKLVEYLLFINVFLIIIGNVSDSDLLASYSRSTRFGSDGIFNKVNESSYLYIIYISSLYYNFINNKGGLIKLIFIVIISFLIGTKTIILYLVLLLSLHIFLVSSINKYVKFVLGLLALITVFYFKKIAIFYFKLIPFWSNLLNDYSITSLLFSKRDYLLKNNLEYVDLNWTPINYLIGGAYYSEKFRITQMDGPDLFLFFGALGVLLYLLFFYKNYFIYKEVVFNIMIVLILICGILSGGFFLSVVAMIYLYLLSTKIRNKEKFNLS